MGPRSSLDASEKLNVLKQLELVRGDIDGLRRQMIKSSKRNETLTLQYMQQVQSTDGKVLVAQIAARLA